MKIQQLTQQLTQRLSKAALALALPLALLGSAAHAPAQTPEQGDARRAGIEQYNLDKNDLALKGYDPVAYFAEGGGKPVKGKKNLTVTHRGVVYRFANEKNKKLFAASPSKYEPAYGGWCAYAMSKGQKVEIDPKSFLIDNGELRVFYKGLFNDTKKKWQKEGPAKLRPLADASWKKISGEDAGR